MFQKCFAKDSINLKNLFGLIILKKSLSYQYRILPPLDRVFIKTLNFARHFSNPSGIEGKVRRSKRRDQGKFIKK